MFSLIPHSLQNHIFLFLQSNEYLNILVTNKTLYIKFHKFRLYSQFNSVIHKIYQEGIRDGYFLQNHYNHIGFSYYDKTHPSDPLYQGRQNVDRMKKNILSIFKLDLN